MNVDSESSDNLITFKTEDGVEFKVNKSIANMLNRYSESILQGK
jgi:hypothetical protein